jgi:hypothetical protein
MSVYVVRGIRRAPQSGTILAITREAGALEKHSGLGLLFRQCFQCWVSLFILPCTSASGLG